MESPSRASRSRPSPNSSLSSRASAARALASRGGTRARRSARGAADATVASSLARGALCLVALAVGVIGMLAVVFPSSGLVAEPVRRVLRVVSGELAVLVPLWLAVGGGLGLWKVARPDWPLPWSRVWGVVAVGLAATGWLGLVSGGPEPLKRARDGFDGGMLGYALGSGLAQLFGPSAARLLLAAGLLAGLLFALRLSPLTLARLSLRLLVGLLRRLLALVRAWGARRAKPAPMPLVPRRSTGLAIRDGLGRLVRRARRPRPATVEPPAEIERPEPVALGRVERSGGRAWKLPPLSLFEPGSATELSPLDLRQRAQVIEETLASFNVDARVVEVNQGPTVTQFGIEPAPGVAVRRILALQNDLALRLAASPVRLEAPVPGKRVVGLEVPNIQAAVVSIRDLLESDEGARIRSRLKLAIGRDVSGRPVVADLARMPHLLIAGATGSGKSVCINALVASLLSQNTPDTLQFIMVDPKMVELMQLNGIPHLRLPVVTDMDRVVGALLWAVREMERRYALLAAHSARNIESYNRLVEGHPTEKPLPYLVLIIDELADMMMTSPDEVETHICRLAQKARATGIHLIVATQRPSVDVLTGLIKANFITRIAFAVSSQVDSRVILDTVGAEKLLGRGDMLLSSGDISKPRRVQGAYVSDGEVRRLVEFWRKQGQPQFTEREVHEISDLGRAEDSEEGDELFERAVGVARSYSKVSTSLLQRRLGVGYPRAARLIDLMEERGVIGPSADGRSREVLERAEADEPD